MEREFFNLLIALGYQKFIEVTQIPDTESKRSNIVPVQLDARSNIVIKNDYCTLLVPMPNSLRIRI